VELYLYLCFNENVSSNYTQEILFINISTSYNEDKSLIDDSNLRSYFLELVSYDRNSYLKKYVINRNFNFDNLDDDFRRYYISSIALKNTVAGQNTTSNFNIDRTYYFNNNLDNWNDFTKETSDSYNASDILNDLSVDNSFNPEDFPYIINDYSLDVIQIAEDDLNQLIIYVYNPSKKLKPNSINLSLDRISYKRYYIDIVSISGTLEKYIVNGFYIDNKEVRNYSISTIYRFYDPIIDVDLSSDYTEISLIGHKVGKHWNVGNKNGEFTYVMEYEDVVEITPIITSYVYYDYVDNYLLYDYSCASHFIGFNVENYIIDKIYDADMSFNVQKYISSSGFNGDKTIEDDIVLKNITLTDIDRVSYIGSWFNEYKWNRIYNSIDFIKDFECNEGVLYETAVEDILSSQFVFCFYENEVLRTSDGFNDIIGSELITDVIILRLKFLSEGETYNLGVVSNGTQSNGESSGEANKDLVDKIDDSISNLSESFEKILSLFLVILGIILLVNIGVPLIKGIKIVFKTFWKILCSPFKFIKRLFNDDKRS